LIVDCWLLIVDCWLLCMKFTMLIPYCNSAAIQFIICADDRRLLLLHMLLSRSDFSDNMIDIISHCLPYVPNVDLTNALLFVVVACCCCCLFVCLLCCLLLLLLLLLLLVDVVVVGCCCWRCIIRYHLNRGKR